MARRHAHSDWLADMRNPSHADLQAEIAALRAVAEIELRNLNTRLSAVEQTQKDLVRVVTQGKTGLRVLIWLGGLMAGCATAIFAFWSSFTGK